MSRNAFRVFAIMDVKYMTFPYISQFCKALAIVEMESIQHG